MGQTSGHLSGALRWTVAPQDANRRVDAWLASRAEVGSRTRARDWIERGKVFRNGREVTFEDAGDRLRPGDEIALWVDRPGSSRTPSRDVVARRSSMRIVFEDRAILVIDKKPGMLVEPLPGETAEVTLRDLVADHLRSHSPARALVVHRIDRDTSGLVLFAKDAASQATLKRQFERRTAERIYLAVLHGRLRESEGTWTDALVWDKARLIQRKARPDESAVTKEAVARYRVLEQFAEAALVEIRLVTGKRNQIRVQAAIRHHPLIGERIYRGQGGGRTGRDGRETHSDAIPRQALHAARLGFRHPSTGVRTEFSAPVPADMRRLIETLRMGG